MSDMNKAKAEIIANMSDIMLESKKFKLAPKTEPAPAPKAKPAPAPKVEPVAEGVDPFYESVEAQQKAGGKDWQAC